MLRRFAGIPPTIVAVALQAVAYAGVQLAIRQMAMTPSSLQFAFICGTLAAILSFFSGLDRWWLPIQLLFVPALVLMLALDFSPSYYLVAFLALLMVYWSTFRTQVPLYLSSDKILYALETLLPPAEPGRTFNFVDLGCGVGGVLIHLAKSRPDGHFRGVESAPLPYLFSWFRAKASGCRNCELHWGNFWSCDLRQYDVVYAYLSPAPMEKLWQKTCSEMRTGALFISSTFTVPGQLPERTVQVEDLHRSTLYIWRM